MAKLIDLTGKKFERLVVVARGENYRGNTARWVCRCDCGNIVTSFGQDLRRGKTLSCGCLHREIAKANKFGLRHGRSRDRLYGIWNGMRNRCDPNVVSPFTKRYSQRGITCCERWSKFENFLADMGDPPTDKHTIDRIDTNGNYEPGNCRWATMKEQARNTRSNRHIQHDGKSLTLCEWAEITGINVATISSRIDRQGWTVADALTTPAIPKTATRAERAAIRGLALRGGGD